MVRKPLHHKIHSETSGAAPDRPPFLHSIVVDRKPWLTREDLRRMATGLKHLYIVTTNTAHPAK